MQVNFREYSGENDTTKLVDLNSEYNFSKNTMAQKKLNIWQLTKKEKNLFLILYETALIEKNTIT